MANSDARITEHRAERAARRRLDESQREAQERLHVAAAELHDEGLSMRDIGSVLNLPRTVRHVSPAAAVYQSGASRLECGRRREVVEVSAVPADDERRDGWLVAYRVEAVFDTNTARSRYDHVTTIARCSCCGESLDLRDTSAVLARHARSHEAQLSSARQARADPVLDPPPPLPRPPGRAPRLSP